MRSSYSGVAAERLGDKAGAEKRYKAALEARPDLDSAAVNLGALYIDGGRFDEALLVTRQGLQKAQKNGALHLNLAVALASKNDVGAAGPAFEEAMKLSPGDPMQVITRNGSRCGADEAATRLRAARPMAKDGRARGHRPRDAPRRGLRRLRADLRQGDRDERCRRASD
ncbi:MAG: tetratricopeptide repeat protein [Polyangiaceae bacterium]